MADCEKDEIATPCQIRSVPADQTDFDGHVNYSKYKREADVDDGEEKSTGNGPTGKCGKSFIIDPINAQWAS